MLEKMSEFFERRLDDYDKHMLNDIEGAREFYSFTAKKMIQKLNCHILDLGCGTGLELEEYFALNPTAHVTGIDLSAGMLQAMKAKFPDKNLTLVCGSYFALPLGVDAYDCAVSVESLHHFTMEEKLPLYQKLCRAIKKGGYFILTDYFAPSDEDEQRFRENLAALKAEQGINDGEFYHYDTPLTVRHETETLLEAGFSMVEQLRRWGNTYTLRAWP